MCWLIAIMFSDWIHCGMFLLGILFGSTDKKRSHSRVHSLMGLISDYDGYIFIRECIRYWEPFASVFAIGVLFANSFANQLTLLWVCSLLKKRYLISLDLQM